MSFRSVFIAVVIGFGAGARRLPGQPAAAAPSRPTQPTAAFVRATGKCAECHAKQQYSVVHEYELSAHAKKGVNCLECHQPAEGQEQHGPPRLHHRQAA